MTVSTKQRSQERQSANSTCRGSPLHYRAQSPSSCPHNPEVLGQGERAGKLSEMRRCWVTGPSSDDSNLCHNEHIKGMLEINYGKTLCPVEAERSSKIGTAWVRMVTVYLPFHCWLVTWPWIKLSKPQFPCLYNGMTITALQSLELY